MTRVQVRPTARTRKRRRQRRLITLSVYVVIVFALAWYFESQGTTTIIFVRHADIDRSMTQDEDVPLNAAGLARAEELADFLDNVDVVAGVNAIYVSPMKRTQQTAAPLAKRLGLEPQVADHTDIVGFTKTALFEHKLEIVLVVSHSNLIAPLVEELHGSKNIAEFAPDEYNRMYIVTIPWWGKVKTLEVPYTAW
jgi:broad specificity phosphatase PhoE